MTWLEYVGIIATILSVVANVFQWLRRNDLRRLFHAELSANHERMKKISDLVLRCRGVFNEVSSPPEELVKLMRHAEHCIGIADSARTDALSFSENYLGKPLTRQHPTKPRLATGDGAAAIRAQAEEATEENADEEAASSED